MTSDQRSALLDEVNPLLRAAITSGGRSPEAAAPSDVCQLDPDSVGARRAGARVIRRERATAYAAELQRLAQMLASKGPGLQASIGLLEAEDRGYGSALELYLHSLCLLMVGEYAQARRIADIAADLAPQDEDLVPELMIVLEHAAARTTPRTVDHGARFPYLYADPLETAPTIPGPPEPPPIPPRDDEGEDATVGKVILASSGTCAFVACQPLPFADIFILTPIQIGMVMGIGQAMGLPVQRRTAWRILGEVVAVIGGGLFIQHTILGLYKLFVPFVGAPLTFPMVFGTTYAIGMAARTYFRICRQRGLDPAEAAREIRKQVTEEVTAHKEQWKREGAQEAQRDMAEERHRLTDENQTLLDSMRRLSAEIDGLEEQLCLGAEREQRLQAQITEQEEEGRRYQVELERVNLERNTIERQVEELSAQLRDGELDQRLRPDLERRLVEAEEQLREKRGEGIRLQQDRDAAEADLRKVLAERDDLARQTALLRGQLDEAGSSRAKEEPRLRRAGEQLVARLAVLYAPIQLHQRARDWYIDQWGRSPDRCIWVERLLTDMRESRARPRRGTIAGCQRRVCEFQFGGEHKGRAYAERLKQGWIVWVLGDQNSQARDIEWLRSLPKDADA